jgi:hypothetical protein
MKATPATSRGGVGIWLDAHSFEPLRYIVALAILNLPLLAKIRQYKHTTHWGAAPSLNG